MRAAALLFVGLVAAAGCEPIWLIAPSDEDTSTLHEGTITADETWRRRDNPHKVTGNLVVAGPGAPTLTLEPGVRVLFTRGAGLQIGTDSLPGALHAAGTRSRPIELMSQHQFRLRGYWGALHFARMAGSSYLERVTVRDCGGVGPFPEACVRIIGGGGLEPRPVMRDVTVAFSGGFGVAAAAGGGFGEGSRNLSVLDTRDFAIRISPNEAWTLPTGGAFFADQDPTVQIPEGTVRRSQIWPDVGIPYTVTRPVTVQGPDGPFLALPAGVELRFGTNGEIRVGMTQPGGLVAEGTAASPIVFTTPGKEPRGWRGLMFGLEASPQSRLAHTVIEYGGLPNGHAVANVTFFRDIGPVLRESTLRHSSGCGIARMGYGGGWGTDFTDASLGNRFSDNHFGPQCTAPPS